MTTYQRLGDHIREVNVRNRDLKVTKLTGYEHIEMLYSFNRQHDRYRYVNI